MTTRSDLACTGIRCKGNETFVRASGKTICPTCSRPYSIHPFCYWSELSPIIANSTRPVYQLNVTCDGIHVKL